MTPERRTIALDHGIYGKPTVTAFCANGLAVYKSGTNKTRPWVVLHEASGKVISDMGRCTRQGAFDVMAALLATSVIWDAPKDTILDQMRANLTAVRLALGTSRDK